MSFFKLSRGFVFLSALSLAIVTASTPFPFIVGKYAWFRGAIDLALVAFALGLLFHDKRGEVWAWLKAAFRKPLVIAASVFTSMFLLAGFFGVDPVMSFWSNFERGEGGLQMLHLLALVVLLVTLFREERDWNRFFGWLLAGGALSIGYGFPAAWDVSGFIGARFAESSFRFQASIGNPAYVAAVLIFMAFYTGYLLWSKYRDRPLSAGAWLLYALLALMAVSFMLAATRGAFIGLIVGALAGGAYLVFARHAWRRWLAAGALALMFLVGTFVQFKDTPFVRAIPGSRIFDLSFTAETFRHRTIMWGIALEGWQSRPLLGWGPENYLQVFDRKFDPAYFEPTKGFGAWFDRAHSIYFDYLVETGALGLLSFLAMFVVFGICVFRKRADESNVKSAVPNALMVGALAAYLVQGAVLFDVLPISYNLFALFAFAAYFLGDHRATVLSRAGFSARWKPAVTAALLALGAVGSLIFGVYAPVALARAYLRASRSLAAVATVGEFAAHFDPVLTHWSIVGRGEVAEWFARSVVGDIVAQGKQSEEGVRALVAYAAPRLSEDNVRHLLAGAYLYELLFDRYGREEEDYERAKEYYMAARVIGPALPPVLYGLFDLAENGGERELAVAVGAEILRRWPDDRDVKNTLETFTRAHGAPVHSLVE